MSGLALRRPNNGGNFTILYFNSSNGSGCFTEPAAVGNPDPRLVYPAPSGSGCPTLLTGRFQAANSLVVNVNQLLGTTGATTYAAIAQPAYSAMIPKVFNANGWWDGFTILSTGSGNATITVRLYNADGTVNASGTANLVTVNSTPLVPRQSVVILGQIPANFVGSASVVSTQPIAVSANSFKIANGGDNIGSYSAIHR